MKTKAQIVFDALKEAEGDFTPQEKELVNAGYIHIKDHQKWGYAPVFKKGSDYKFVYQGKVMSAQEMYDDLVANWRPAAQSERDWMVSQMKSEFKAIGAKVN